MEPRDRTDGAPRAARSARPARSGRPGGFTLIELLIGVAVATILLTQALPAYNGFMMRSRRADAKAALLNLQVLQERYRMSNPGYATLAQLGAAAKSAQGYYDLAVTNQTATTYTITATAAAGSAQAADTACRSLALTQDGPDRGSAQAVECWK